MLSAGRQGGRTAAEMLRGGAQVQGAVTGWRWCGILGRGGGDGNGFALPTVPGPGVLEPDLDHLVGVADGLRYL